MAVTVPAKWQRPGRRGKTPRLIVVHCTVSPETGTGAEAVARYFQTVARPASAHLVADNNSVVRCVADENTAMGAAGANDDGLHLELVGLPTQTTVQWRDPFSKDMFAQAAPHIQAWSATYQIPLRWLTVAQVADGQTKGLCTHADVSAAFPSISTGHWDPGPDFPKDDALVAWAPHVSPPKDVADMTTKELIDALNAAATAGQLDPFFVRLRQKMEEAGNDLAEIKAVVKATDARVDKLDG